MMMKRIVTILLGLFVLWDLCHSYEQYLYMSLDGDVADNVVPAKAYEHVLKDPFGWDALTKKERVAGANRFFAHGSMYVYLRSAPQALQAVTDPVNSVYMACALFRLFVHILLICLLAVYVTGSFSPFKHQFILALALISPLLQVNYYAIYMGVIDHSITYTFFYAFPLALTLLFFLPLYQKRKMNLVRGLLLVILLVVLVFNGPLIPPVFLVVSAIVLMPHFFSMYKNRGMELPNGTFFTAPVVFLLTGSVLSMYSLYIGTFNSDSFAHTAPLSERYMRLPSGIYNILTQKLGYPLLLLMICINVVVIRNKSHAEGKRILNMLRYIGAFSLLYILLLPLGGYREYRPNILRYDTVMPITIALIFFYAKSGFFILGNLDALRTKVYMVLLIGFSAVFTIADIDVEKDNLCEREAFKQIAATPRDTVKLDTACTVLSWGLMHDVKYSEVNGKMLYLWRITDRRKLYYQQ